MVKIWKNERKKLSASFAQSRVISSPYVWKMKRASKQEEAEVAVSDYQKAEASVKKQRLPTREEGEDEDEEDLPLRSMVR